MITKEKILELIQPILDEKGFYVVTLNVDVQNNIHLYVDSMKGVRIDECVMLSRSIEQGLDRESEDFSLEVSSAGLDMPFQVKEQYQKNLDREIKIFLPDGRAEEGKLLEADDEGFKVEQAKMERVEGKKKKQKIISNKYFTYNDISKVKLVINFK